MIVSLVIFALAVGAVAGYFAGGEQRSSELRSAYSQFDEPRTKSERLAADNRHLSARLRKSSVHPSSGNQSAPEPRSRGDMTPVEKLQVRVEFQQGKMVRPSLTFFDRQGRLNDSFASLFALTPVERARQEEALHDARQKLAKREHSKSKVSRDEKGKVEQRSAGGGLSGNTNNTRFRTYEELAARVGPIISIIPPDFKRTK
jgi:hypothetical protein